MNTASLRAILEKPERTSARSHPASPTEGETDAEYEAYANGRIGNRPQLMLALRKADGSLRVFAYTYLYSIAADDPARGFVLDFSQEKVAVHGRHLERLLDLIRQHKVLEIVEAPRSQTFEQPPGAPLVEAITFGSPTVAAARRL